MATTMTVWEQAQGTFGVIASQHIRQPLQEAIQNSEIGKIDGWGRIGMAMAIKPEPLTLEQVTVRDPFTKPEKNLDVLKKLTEAGYLSEAGIVTEKGEREYKVFVDMQNGILSDLAEQFNGDGEKLATLMQAIVDGALALDDAPIAKIATYLDVSDMPAMQRAFYHIQRLFAFRDDAHLNAWRDLDLAGSEFEAFSLAWSGEAQSAEKALEIRPYRGYSLEEWQAAYDAMVEKRWLQQVDGVYETTAEGKRIREDIEAKTDAYFYGPFERLTEAQRDELVDLLKAVEDQFKLEPAEA